MSRRDLVPLIDRISGQCIASRWRAANRIITNVYDEALRPLGVKVSQFNILVATARLGVARPAAISAHLRLESSTVSRNVERMRASGWLETVPDADDRRAQPFQLTRAGWKLVERAYPLWEMAQEKAAVLLGDEGASLLERVDSRARGADK